ncbi:MAG TPA: alpha/beta hydrolase [Candidatus Bathyarchaeia archaeon]|nr:alpha/beta hydrolase [Candidatus Bathyarchaeia archaeon]
MTSRSSYLCDAATRRSFVVNGMTLRALEWGEPGRPSLCFLHGGSAHAHWFDEVVPRFVDRFHVISLDQRGHGESDWAPDSRYGTEQFASDLLGVFDALGWGQVVLVGHSMGGHNAMAFAAWHPDRVRMLCVVDSRPALPVGRLEAMHRRGHRGPRRHESLDLALKSFRLLPADTLAAPELLEHLGREGIVEREGRFLYRFDPQCNGARQPVDGWEIIHRIQAPTLLVRGELSPILPMEMGERMLALIPKARLVTMPGVYHHLVLDAPEAFAGILDDFVR